MGLLGKHFGGSLPFSRMEKMSRRELQRYYRIYEKQAVEEEIRNEYLYPLPPLKPRAIPAPLKMKLLVKERIEKYHKKAL